jgi:hypothetical protein
MSAPLCIFVDVGASSALAAAHDGQVLGVLHVRKVAADVLDVRIRALLTLLRDLSQDVRAGGIVLACEAPWAGLRVSTYGVLMQHVAVWHVAAQVLCLRHVEPVSPAAWRASWGMPTAQKRELAKATAIELVTSRGLWTLPAKGAEDVAEAVLGALYLDREQRGVEHDMRRPKAPRRRKPPKPT